MQIKHIYWFAYFDVSEPSVRYRATYPLQQLHDQYGITYSIVYPGYDARTVLHFLHIYFSVLFFRRRDSLLVFQKIYTRGIYAKALKFLLFFRKEHTLYDIDDAEHTRQPVETMHHFMRRCSACSAGSQALVGYIRPFNQEVFLLTSPVMDHGLLKTKMNDRLHVGWIGYYAAHRQSLRQLFFPALRRIDFPLKLTLLGVADEVEAEEINSYFTEWDHISVDTPLDVDWQNEQAIYETIATFDLGVSPLLDTEFNRAKSAFKLKQCMSCAVPVLGSSVGENKHFLQDGVNGYLCEQAEDYVLRLKAIKHLEESVYAKLSANAKATFPSFSMDSYCKTLLAYFK